MATHSSILAWRVPWTEEPGGLQSIRLHRVRHNCATWNACMQGTTEAPSRVFCWSLPGLGWNSISTKLWFGKAECPRHAWVSFFIIEFRMSIKSYPMLFFLNHPCYLGTMQPWQNPGKGMHRTVYKDLISSCPDSDSNTISVCSLFLRVALLMVEKNVPNWAYFSRESGWFLLALFSFLIPFRKIFAFSWTMLESQYGCSLKKKKTFPLTEARRVSFCVTESKEFPWVLHEQHPWDFPWSQAGPCQSWRCAWPSQEQAQHLQPPGTI